MGIGSASRGRRTNPDGCHRRKSISPPEKLPNQISPEQDKRDEYSADEEREREKKICNFIKNIQGRGMKRPGASSGFRSWNSRPANWLQPTFQSTNKNPRPNQHTLKVNVRKSAKIPPINLSTPRPKTPSCSRGMRHSDSCYVQNPKVSLHLICTAIESTLLKLRQSACCSNGRNGRHAIHPPADR